MEYASGEEPMVGDVVECVDVGELGNGRLRKEESYTVLSLSGPYIETGKDCFWMPWRFKLLRRSTPEQPAATEPTLTELMELRDRAEKASDSDVNIGIGTHGGLWLIASGTCEEYMTPESLRAKLVEFAAQKLPGELPVTLPTDVVKWCGTGNRHLPIPDTIREQLESACMMSLKESTK